MNTLNSLFEKLLENIEPESKYKNYAIEAHTRVREHLESEDSTFSEYVIDSFLYGSYKRQTAVGNIKDVDIVLVTNLDHDKDEHKPSKMLPKLKKALTVFYGDPGATEYQRKSIQVNDPLPDEEDAELTLDIIPAILTNTIEDKLLVPDTHTDTWIESHPKGHLAFTTMMNDDSHGKGRFVPLVKIFKYWWSQHSGVDSAKPKGFWLEILAGYEFDPSKETYAEHFTTLLQNISNRFDDYENFTEVPSIDDPALPGETLKTSMTLGEFVHFMDAVNDTLQISQEALESEDDYQSISLWHAIFGDKFPTGPQKSKVDISRFIKFIESFIAPNEQHLERDFGIGFQELGYKVNFDGWVTKNKGFRDSHVSKLALIQKKADILFEVSYCTVPEPYSVKWKIKNTGKEAARLNVQRGEIHNDEGKKQRRESTLYTGTHYVECYVIKDNFCVAWDRIKVRIS